MGDVDRGEQGFGRLVGWEVALALYNTPPLIKSISLTAVSDQDAVLDLPPFEKVWTRPAALARKL